MKRINVTKYKIAIIAGDILIILIVIYFLYMRFNSQSLDHDNSARPLNKIDTFIVQNDKVNINVLNCRNLQTTRIDNDQGSISIKIIGISNNNCVFYYGSEMENPAMNGEPSYKCTIPTSLKLVVFPKIVTPNSSREIDKYCQNINNIR